MTSHSNSFTSASRPETHAEWCITFGRPPPKHLSTSFMLRALGWDPTSFLTERLILFGG